MGAHGLHHSRAPCPMQACTETWPHARAGPPSRDIEYLLGAQLRRRHFCSRPCRHVAEVAFGCLGGLSMVKVPRARCTPPPPITTATTTTTPTHPSAPTSAAAPEAHLCSALPSRPDRREPSPHVDGGPHLDRCLPHPNPGWLSFSSSAPFRLRARPIEGALVRVRAPFYELGPDGTAKP